MRRLGQGGFATLEVILMVTVLGILAAIAVPRFEDVTARANTAKVQSDLTTIDTAIQLYEMNETAALTNGADISVLKKYLTDAENIVPPQSGKIFMGGTSAEALPSDKKYVISSADADKGGGFRGTFGGKTSGEFGYKSAAGNG